MSDHCDICGKKIEANDDAIIFQSRKYHISDDDSILDRCFVPYVVCCRCSIMENAGGVHLRAQMKMLHRALAEHQAKAESNPE